jgi:hypothetical protein
MPTPHPHARYVRRARKIPLHARYNPRKDAPPYIPTYPPPPLPYPGGGDQSTPTTPSPPDELAGLPGGFVYFIGAGGVFFTDPSGNLFIGAI